MSHPMATLSPIGRLRLARCVVEDGWPLRRAAERFEVSATTAARWGERYRQLGEAGMLDRFCRSRPCSAQTPTRFERRIIKVRIARRWGPARIGYLLSVHPSTVHRVLTRYRLARLAWLDRATGQVVRRYEHGRPRDLIHVDIKKLGRSQTAAAGAARGAPRGAATAARPPPRRSGHPVIGCAYLHNAVDDHSRLAYSEILTDERKETAAAFWRRAQAWFDGCGITVHGS